MEKNHSKNCFINRTIYIYISMSASTPSLTFVKKNNVNENTFKNTYSVVPNNSTLSLIITVPLWKLKKKNNTCTSITVGLLVVTPTKIEINFIEKMQWKKNQIGGLSRYSR